VSTALSLAEPWVRPVPPLNAAGGAAREAARPTPDRAAERELVARAVAGDAGAERALYDAHVERVYRLAYRMAGDDDLARDITQDTFVRAFGRLATFRHESAFATWLHRITMSVALSALDSAQRRGRREAPLEDDLAAPERGGDPDLRARLAAAIDALPPGYRAVFVLHDVEGYTHEEIGAALGVRPGTSKAQLFHARARLRERLAAYRRPD
jgi:RNA polymerase sigma-70 factor (ECF subfamily)